MKIFFVVKRKNTLPKNQQQFKSIIQGNALLEKKTAFIPIPIKLKSTRADI